ncbi:type II toxin-antitoxin system RelB family antitoxin [Exiguobacterium undae]
MSTISTLVYDAVLDRIEDEMDLQLYHDSMAAYRKKSESISFDDMMKELDLE